MACVGNPAGHGHGALMLPPFCADANQDRQRLVSRKKKRGEYEIHEAAEEENLKQDEKEIGEAVLQASALAAVEGYISLGVRGELCAREGFMACVGNPAGHGHGALMLPPFCADANQGRQRLVSVKKKRGEDEIHEAAEEDNLKQDEDEIGGAVEDLQALVDSINSVSLFDYTEEEIATMLAEELANRERLRLEAEKEAEEKKRKEEATLEAWKKRDALVESVYEYDDKLGYRVCTRYCFHCSDLDLDELSLVRPMRYTSRIFKKGREMFNSANILSVKIVSDVGYPIHVYGSVIARDSLDHRCIYLFDCSREDCQLINSLDESLILTGPSRGLLLIDYIYIEVNLKIKAFGGQTDRVLSKGLMLIDGRVVELEKNRVKICDLDTRLSTVEVEYATVRKAVEATVVFSVLKGDFTGEITAHTTSIKNRIVLYDSKAGGVVGSVKLSRHVVAVSLDEMLIFNIATPSATRTIEFTAFPAGFDTYRFSCGDVEMDVEVTWSLIDI